MTNEAYDKAYVALRDLMFSQTFYAMTTIVGYGIYFEKKSIYSLVAVSAGAMLNLGMNFILIPKYGIAAAAFTTFAGYGLNYFLTLYFSEKMYPCEYGQGKVLISFVVLYIISLAGSEKKLWIKFLIWSMGAVGMTVYYRILLKNISIYVKTVFLHRKIRK